MTVSWLRRSVAGLSRPRPWFNTVPFHIGFMVKKVARRQVFLSVFRFSVVFVIPVMLRTHFYHQAYCACERNELCSLQSSCRRFDICSAGTYCESYCTITHRKHKRTIPVFSIEHIILMWVIPVCYFNASDDKHRHTTVCIYVCMYVYIYIYCTLCL
jgi:hypothetical protein